jgi:hypothetical protein
MSGRLSLPVARGAALLVLGALAVHQLRYLLAFGPETGEALHREGHGYLAQGLPILVALAVAAVAATLVARALAGRPRPSRLASGMRRALLYAAGLVAVFSVQELAEGALAPGHPAGLDALVANGGWIAVPLAFAFGAVAAVAERLLARTDAAIAAVLDGRPAPPAVPEPAALSPSFRGAPLMAAPLAFGLARRPPPLPARA